MHVKEMVVTPEMAKIWLEYNEGNRPIRESHVEALALAMIGGEWQLTHQGIAFDHEGRLLDGQHRLRAIVMSETPVPMLVAYNMDPKAFSALDRGKMRSIADVLRSDKYDTEMATFVARVLNKGQHPTPPMVMNVLQAYATELAAFREAIPRTKTKKISAASVRAAVLVRSASLGTRTYILSNYANMITLRLEEVPPILQSFTRQLLTKDIHSKGTGSGTAEVFVRAFQAFDPKRADVPKLSVKEPEAQFAEAIKMIRNKLNQ